jgi:hypothetical protein
MVTATTPGSVARGARTVLWRAKKITETDQFIRREGSSDECDWAVDRPNTRVSARWSNDANHHRLIANTCPQETAGHQKQHQERRPLNKRASPLAQDT